MPRGHWIRSSGTPSSSFRKLLIENASDTQLCKRLQSTWTTAAAGVDNKGYALTPEVEEGTHVGQTAENVQNGGAEASANLLYLILKYRSKR